MRKELQAYAGIFLTPHFSSFILFLHTADSSIYFISCASIYLYNHSTIRALTDHGCFVLLHSTAQTPSTKLLATHLSLSNRLTFPITTDNPSILVPASAYRLTRTSSPSNNLQLRATITSHNTKRHRRVRQRRQTQPPPPSPHFHISSRYPIQLYFRTLSI